MYLVLIFRCPVYPFLSELMQCLLSYSRIVLLYFIRDNDETTDSTYDKIQGSFLLNKLRKYIPFDFRKVKYSAK
jgi:hypothetical protein